MRFIDIRRRLCQDKSDLSSSPTPGKSDGYISRVLARKSESHNSLHLDLDSFQHKLSLSPSPGNNVRTRSEVIHKLLPDSPSSVNIDLNCDSDSGEK